MHISIKFAPLISTHSLAFGLLAASGLCAMSAGGLLADDAPAEYVVDYPRATTFCPPLRSYFHDVLRSGQQIGARTVRYKPNGGYGFPVRRKVNGKNLIHVGADVGWTRVGEPVFCVADGVVRVSEGPDRKKSDKKKAPQSRVMPWGNFIAVEHRMPDDTFATTIYGHLGQKRLVRVSQLVRAGQQIGIIGKKSFTINGGYQPHLHFGVRKGRFAEPGAELFELSVNDTNVSVKIAKVTARHLDLDDSGQLPDSITFTLNDRPYQIERTGDLLRMPAEVLWHAQRPGFALVGYELSTDDWHDPTVFLRQQRADLAPAPYFSAPPDK